MSTPPLIPDSDTTDLGWRRKVRDAVNGLIKRTSGQGATADRPKNPTTGQQYYDTSLGIPVWFNGTNWKNAAGTTV